ncbi:chorismate mutase [Bacillota bacterium LX-D]|nr:chorismate mutase [Bacillota bacterium LX-D]
MGTELYIKSDNMAVRGIRGAITVEKNSRENIYDATKVLLTAMLYENDILLEDIASAFFSVTNDLDQAYPAEAARKMGWVNVPLLCLNEANISGSLRKVIRVLLHVNTTKKQQEIKHIYLGKAKELRKDL